MSQLTFETIQKRLQTRFVGRHGEFYESIDSTNIRAVALAVAEAPHGTLVVANAQTAGKGRLGRSWQAPMGSSLLFSLVLRPDIQLMHAQWTTMICSLAAVRAIREVTGVRVFIKWPNDLTVNGKKLGGVLTELCARGSQLAYAVVGMGINVNLDPSLLGKIMTPATSLMAETGHEVSRLDVLLALLRHVEAYLDLLDTGWQPHTDWQANLETINKTVSVGTSEGVFTGVAVGVDEFGALLVQDVHGECRTFYVGDVTLRGHQL